ncbi:MAG: thioredoxin domain-containing protein [Nitrospinaceae bacterium]|nr:thioredoxin domain-containing protein [Nitrospinaceae bacterium]
MRRSLLLIIPLSIAIFFFYDGAFAAKPYNRLVHEKSPYLLQHKDNPIHWYAWGEEALQAAREQNKPIFLSIGYSTCHWCHVLEKESFENEEVAAMLNESFICIKVDREEHPDVDQFYMNVVQAMTGSGGWPLTVIMTPEKIPVFGGTYFPKNELMKIIGALSTAWIEQPKKIKAVGDTVRKFIEAGDRISTQSVTLDETLMKEFYKKSRISYDEENGGFGLAPKFPPTMKMRLLLRIAQRTGDKHAIKMVASTLEAMARGGIYDHLGGGFHRYSTDSIWLVPHFEKMLYDQAALATVYIEGYQVTQNEVFKSVARGVLDYVLKDMTGPQGGFYSAEDADSEGEEGTFYVWSDAELKKVLTLEEYQQAIKVFGVTPQGNFEVTGENILHLSKGVSWEESSSLEVKNLSKKLLQFREKRERPFKDDKVLTAWNGLMISAMAKAAQVFQDEVYLRAAQKSAQFIKANLYKNGKLARRFRDSEAKFTASLDDYAYLIQGLVDLYEADFDEQWLGWANVLQKKQDELFWDKESGGYYFSEAKGSLLPGRNRNFEDNARPNSNAVSALNLLKLYNFTLHKPYRDKAKNIFTLAGEMMSRSHNAFAQMFIALDFYLDKSKEVVVVGPKQSKEKDAILRMLRTEFLPNKTVGYIPPDSKSSFPVLENKVTAEGRTIVYVCENNVCKFPTEDLKKARQLVRENKEYSLN